MPFNVTMPDGTIVQNVPEGITQSQLSSRYQSYQPSAAQSAQSTLTSADASSTSDIGKELYGQSNDTNSLSNPSFSNKVTPSSIGSDIKTAATAVPASVANIFDRVSVAMQPTDDPEIQRLRDRGMIPQEYSGSTVHHLIQSYNESRQSDIDQGYLGQAADTVGSLPLLAATPEVGLADAAIAKSGMNTLPKLVARAVNWGGKQAAYGMEGAATQPLPNTDNIEDLKAQNTQDLTSGGEVGLALGTVGKVASDTSGLISKGLGVGKFSKDALESEGAKRIGQATTQSEMDIAAKTEASLKGSGITPTLDELADSPGLAQLKNTNAAAGNIKVDGEKVNPALDYYLNSEKNKDTLAQQVLPKVGEGSDKSALGTAAENTVNTTKTGIDAEVAKAQRAADEANKNKNAQGTLLSKTSPTEVNAATTTGETAVNTVNAANQKSRDDYTNLDPNGIIPHTVDRAASIANEIKQNPAIYKAFKLDNDTNLVDKYAVNPSEHNDMYMSNKESTVGASPTVKDVVQDNMKLSGIIDRLGDNKDATYDAAVALKQANKQDLSANSHPSAIEGKSVSEGVQEADKNFIDKQRNLYENTSIAPTKNGEAYAYPRSATGNLSDRITQWPPKVDEAAAEGRKILPVNDDGAFNASLRNVKNYPNADGAINSPGFVANHLLGAVNDNIKADGSNALEAFDKIVTNDKKTGLIKNGLTQTNSYLSELRDKLATAHGNAEQQASILKDAQAKAKDSTDKLEKSLAFKLLDEHGTALPQSMQIDRVMANDKSKQDALKLVQAQDDNGASARGLGKAVYDRILDKSSDNATSLAHNIENGEKAQVKRLDPVKFNTALKENAELLKQTLGESEYQKAVNGGTIASIIDKSKSAPNAYEAASALENLNKAGAKGLVQKVGRFSYTAINAVFQALSLNTEKQIQGVIYKAMNDREYGNKLWEAYKGMDKSPSEFKQLISDTSKNIPAFVGGKVSNPEDVTTQPKKNNIDNEVNKVYNKSDNSGSIFDAINPVGTAKADGISDLIDKFNNERKPGGIGPVGGEVHLTGTKNDVAQVVPTDKLSDTIQKTADKWHIPVAYLKGLQQSESGGEVNPLTAKPKDGSTSAVGPFQFTTGTWEQVRKAYPFLHLPAIGQGKDPRTDPQLSATAAAALTTNNVHELSKVVDRPVTMADARLAHVGGLAGAKKILTAKPSEIAADVLPQAAKNNPNLFYKNGKALNIRAFYTNLEKPYKDNTTDVYN